MKKCFLILVAMLFTTIAFAQPRLPYHSVQIVDERGVTVTSITSVEIYAPDTTTNAVIYSDRGLNNLMTIPITTGSTNTTLVNGVLSWYGPDGYDFSITDGTNIATNANHRTRTSSEGTLVFPSYITAISSTTYSDAQSATWGTSGDWVQAGGTPADTLTFTPLNDNANFIIGVSGTSKNSDFNVYVGTLLGLKVDAGTPSFIWDGGVVTLNENSNFSVGLCTGSSTGAITLGSSTSGTITLDTTAGISITADDSYALVVTAGTIDIDSTGGDFGIDATDSSILIDAGESVTDAIVIAATGAAGGVELTSGTGDITLDSGDDIFLEANTGTGDVISIINTAGTDASSLILRTVAAGSIDIDSGDNITIDVADDYTVDTADGGITFIADGATNGDITLDAEDDIILITTGSLTVTNTDAMTVSGALTVTGDIQLISVTRIDTPTEIVAATNAIEITESGTVYILTNATEFATTLPTVASSAGVTYRFICGAVPSGADYTVLTDSSENKIWGSITAGGAAAAADGPDDTITFLRDQAAIGDWCELTSDGVLWYLSGQSVSATGVVPSQAG